MPEHSDVAVVSVMIAGEGNTNDYNNDMLNPERSIGNYDANQMMEYLFLAPLQLIFELPNRIAVVNIMERSFPQTSAKVFKTYLHVLVLS